MWMKCHCLYKKEEKGKNNDYSCLLAYAEGCIDAGQGRKETFFTL